MMSNLQTGPSITFGFPMMEHVENINVNERLTTQEMVLMELQRMNVELREIHVKVDYLVQPWYQRWYQRIRAVMEKL